MDNGEGIKSDFLKVDKSGVQRIFKENISSKNNSDNSGYGCYIAYENCRRCGWTIEARNNKQGAVVQILIPVN